MSCAPRIAGSDTKRGRVASPSTGGTAALREREDVATRPRTTASTAAVAKPARARRRVTRIRTGITAADRQDEGPQQPGGRRSPVGGVDAGAERQRGRQRGQDQVRGRDRAQGQRQQQVLQPQALPEPSVDQVGDQERDERVGGLERDVECRCAVREPDEREEHHPEGDRSTDHQHGCCQRSGVPVIALAPVRGHAWDSRGYGRVVDRNRPMSGPSSPGGGSGRPCRSTVCRAAVTCRHEGRRRPLAPGQPQRSDSSPSSSSAEFSARAMGSHCWYAYGKPLRCTACATSVSRRVFHRGTWTSRS